MSNTCGISPRYFSFVIVCSYGDDGLDVTKAKMLGNFGFLASNYRAMLDRVGAESSENFDQTVSLEHRFRLRWSRGMDAKKICHRICARFFPNTLSLASYI